MDCKVELYEVNISTVNRCNRHCPYCKYGQKYLPEMTIMDSELFDKILNDLREHHFNGIISPFAGNEPLLDKRIFMFVESITKILPDAKSFIYSNGDLLDEKKLIRLYDAGISKIYVSLHDNHRLHDLLEYKKNAPEKLEILKMYELDKNSFHNFAGLIKTDIVNQERHLTSGCILPFRQMVINPDGSIDLCCVDINNDTTFDNVRNKSAVDIFYNDPLLNIIRSKLLQNNRKGLYLCEKCSFNGYSPKNVL